MRRDRQRSRIYRLVSGYVFFLKRNRAPINPLAYITSHILFLGLEYVSIHRGRDLLPYVLDLRFSFLWC
jgi:hypothetical protein